MASRSRPSARGAPAGPRPRRSGAAGLTLVELAVVLTILVLGVSFMTGTLSSIVRLAPIQRETARALEAARTRLEEMRAATFQEIYARYDADPSNNPGGGSSPGAGFAVPGLEPLAGDADLLCGRVVLPTAGNALREDVVDPELGMPRDLDLDGAIDGADHASDYEVLPVRILVEWSSQGHARRMELATQITRP